MHVQAHSTSQQVLSATPPTGPVVLALVAEILLPATRPLIDEHSPEPILKEARHARAVRTPNTLTTHKPDEGAYLRLALKARQLDQRFPPTSSCYEVEDRSLPSVSSF
jgi:hypothetical protein